MRKITSAIFILILLFNLFGYRFVADYIQAKNDTRLEARLDADHFDESSLVEIKVPLNLPYQTSWSDFQRYDGEMELNGVLYKYVKRKISNDTLVLLCLPNQQKMELMAAKNDFFKNTNDIAQNGSKKSGSSKSVDIKKQANEYDDQAFNFKPQALLIDINITTLSLQVFKLLSSPHVSPAQPPDFTHA